MSDTLAQGERANVLVPTKSCVLETGKEAIQTSKKNMPDKRPRFTWNNMYIVLTIIT